MTAQDRAESVEDIDLGTLGRALWRAKGWILSLAALAGVVTFVALSMVRPLYTSEARILIENDASPFTRAATDDRNEQRVSLDEQAVESQVQVLTSRDLALQVTRDLDLVNNPAFEKDSGTTLLARVLNRIGLGGSDKSKEEKAADAFLEHLSVYVVTKSNVISVNYTSGDPELAAKAANALADAYIAWQRNAKLDQTKDATAWLSTQIEELRKRVSESEAAAEKFRSSHGLFAGTNNVTLNAQQLSELNSQLILAKAQRSEAEARARLIREMLEDKADIDATPEVLKSELIGRLIEQRVQVQRQLAELSATLLPSHPRMKQLASEITDIRLQIRQEAGKIVQGLENESQIAAARETSLRNSLKEVQSQASGQSDAEIQLRALEREAKANRDLLESYLARYRDASAHHDMGAVPATATIVSRAHPATKPSFPKRGPISALAAAAAAILSLAFVMTRELIGGEARHSMRAEAARRDPEDVLDFEPPSAPARHRSRGHGEARMRKPDMTEDVSMAAFEAKKRGRDPETMTDDLTDAWTNRPEPVQRSAPKGGLLERMRRVLPISPSKAPEVTEPEEEPAREAETAPMREPEADDTPPNDLRAYLRRKAALQSQAAATPKPRKARPKARGTVGPMLKSIEALVVQIRARSSAATPRVVLVVPGSREAEATEDAILLARLLSKRERAILIDLTRGPAAVSGSLGIPRAPGFTDLAAGKAGFEDVVQPDDESSLQVIPAGNPHTRGADGEAEETGRFIEALAQVYDRLVLHIDRETLLKLDAALAGRLQMVVAVLAPGENLTHDQATVAELTALGAPVVPFEQTGDAGRPRRSGFFGRAAAV